MARVHSALLSARLLVYETPTADDRVAQVQLKRSKNKPSGELKAYPGSQGPVLPLTHSLGFPAITGLKTVYSTEFQNWGPGGRSWSRSRLTKLMVSGPAYRNQEARGQTAHRTERVW